MGAAEFRTTPARGDADTVVRFGTTSCLAVAERLTWGAAGFGHMLSRNLTYHLFIGDFVYSDIPYSVVGLGGASRLYDAHYRITLSDDFAADFLRRVPGWFQVDDHEIVNDWLPEVDTVRVDTAMKAWTKFVGLTNPLHFEATPSTEDAGSLPFHYNGTAGTVAFFVFDSRVGRTADAIVT